MEGKLEEGRARRGDRKDWEVNLRRKMENWWVQTARARSIGGTMDVNMINNSVDEACVFCRPSPLGPVLYTVLLLF